MFKQIQKGVNYMKIKDIRLLVEHGAIDTIMATKSKDGWYLVVLKNKSSGNDVEDYIYLETARGGVRKFSTLDAIKSLMVEKLYNHQFLVC